MHLNQSLDVTTSASSAARRRRTAGTSLNLAPGELHQRSMRLPSPGAQALADATTRQNTGRTPPPIASVTQTELVRARFRAKARTFVSARMPGPPRRLDTPAGCYRLGRYMSESADRSPADSCFRPGCESRRRLAPYDRGSSVGAVSRGSSSVPETAGFVEERRSRLALLLLVASERPVGAGGDARVHAQEEWPQTALTLTAGCPAGVGGAARAAPRSGWRARRRTLRRGAFPSPRWPGRVPR
jgi:hypothetical protein